MLLYLWSEESVSIVEHFSVSLSDWPLLVFKVLLLIFDSAMFNEVLGLLKKCFMLGLEHLELLKGIISNLLKLSLILLIDLLLNVSPIVL